MESLDSEIEFNILVSFIREEISEYRINIDQQTLIEDDLGVTGDEAIELIQTFAKKFDINITDFEYSKYFYPEPSIFNVVTPVKPLTIGNLYDSLKLGKLV